MFTALQAQVGGITQLSSLPDAGAAGSADRDPDEPRHLVQRAIVDISAGATVTVPDAGVRYVSVMIVNEDHYGT